VEVITTDKNDTVYKNEYGIHQFIPLSYVFLPVKPVFRQDSITGNYRRMKHLHPQTSGGNYAILQYFQVVFFSLNMALQG
jgi:hypothetical protein